MFKKRKIKQAFGIPFRKKTVFHDLDYLAGTWNDKDKKIFDEQTKSFEKIDKGLLN